MTDMPYQLPFPDNDVDTEYDFPLWDKMSLDVRSLAFPFERRSVRELVSIYYRIQKNRIACAAQSRELQEAGFPHELVKYLADNLQFMESSLKYPLQRFAETYPVGLWALKQYGVGPVITAGLIAHIDIEKAPTVGSIWRFGGVDPTCKWEKGKKRPWNREFQTLIWKIGQSFMLFSNEDKCFYGKFYKQDKERRIAKNKAGGFAERAKQILASKNWSNDNVSRRRLQEGFLPDKHITAQATRYAAKIFLSHFHKVWYENHYNKKAPTPYVIAHMGHVHEIEVPGYESPFE